jgi:nucleoside 2-deoxyribosyltransferase
MGSTEPAFKKARTAVDSSFERLAKGELTIYHCCQLFDYRSKIQSDEFESAMLRGVNAAASKRKLDIEKYPVFMPFRDTDQSKLAGADVTYEIYKMDMSHLDSVTFAVIGFSDGLGKDSGEMFELGRCFAMGLPSIIASSDFFWLSNRWLDGSQKELLQFPFDPVIMAGVGKVVLHSDIPSLGEDTVLASRDWASMTVKKAQHRRRLEAGFAEFHNKIAQETERLCLQPSDFVKAVPADKGLGQTVYLALEGIYEWQVQKMDELQKALEGKGLRVLRDRRFEAARQREFCERFGDNAVVELGRADLADLVRSDVVVVTCDAAEAPAGPAFMQGYARTAEKKVIDYCTGNMQMNGPGGYRSLVNSMLHYSADVIASSSQEVVAEACKLLA